MIKLIKNKIKMILQNRNINQSITDLAIISKIHDFQTVRQENIIGDNFRIAFLVLGFSGFSGGITNIFRLGTHLAGMGHEIYYIILNDSNLKILEENAKIAHPGYSGKLVKLKDSKNFSFDVGIATAWFSCYYLLANMNLFKYKVYFIQDFEPYFYPVGDYYFLAQNTYKQGFHMISLGHWCKSVIEEKFPSTRVDAIDFPVDIEQYQITPRKIAINKEIRVATYLKMEDRRAPFLLINQLKYLEKELLKRGYQVEINIFGIDRTLKIPVGTNLGLLNHDELLELYKKSHFGIVASMTNISIVNYEMIASGLPVIDFLEGSAPNFCSMNEMIFIQTGLTEVFEKIWYFLNHQDQLNDLTKQAQKNLERKKATWQQFASRFNKIIIDQKSL